MPDYKKDIERIKNPENIREAVYASSPYVLRKAFQHDSTVGRLIKGGGQVASLIRNELGAGSLKLPEITLACLVYVLENIQPETVSEVLKPLMRKAMDAPGPFFIHFAAHALRRQAGLQLRPLELVYKKAEILEALAKI